MGARAPAAAKPGPAPSIASSTTKLDSLTPQPDPTARTTSAAAAAAPAPATPEALRAQLQHISRTDVLDGVAAVLEHFVSCADARAADASTPPPPQTPFDGIAVPAIGIRAYLEHIMNSNLCSKECFVMALVYGERLLQCHPEFVIARRNVHRLVLISIMVASKILDDFYCRNMYYSLAGGISKTELNTLELQFCFLLDFDLNVSVQEFSTYCATLMRDPPTPGVSPNPSPRASPTKDVASPLPGRSARFLASRSTRTATAPAAAVARPTHNPSALRHATTMPYGSGMATMAPPPPPPPSTTSAMMMVAPAFAAADPHMAPQHLLGPQHPAAMVTDLPYRFPPQEAYGGAAASHAHAHYYDMPPQQPQGWASHAMACPCASCAPAMYAPPPMPTYAPPHHHNPYGGMAMTSMAPPAHALYAAHLQQQHLMHMQLLHEHQQQQQAAAAAAAAAQFHHSVSSAAPPFSAFSAIPLPQSQAPHPGLATSKAELMWALHPSCGNAAGAPHSMTDAPELAWIAAGL